MIDTSIRTGATMADTDRESWRVVLFSDFAGLIVSMHDILRTSGHRIVAVMTAAPPARRAGAADYLSVVEAATSLKIPVVVSNRRAGWPALVRAFEPDLIMSAGFLWKIPGEVIATPRLGTINNHGGLLPRNRGANPVGWAFRNDDGRQGWTVHRMTEEWDTGPVLAQRWLEYGDDDNIDTILPRYIELIPETVRDALDAVARSEPGTPQDESLATDAPLFEPEWRFINWSRPARQIHNQVRSWAPGRGSPAGAYGVVDGRELLILRTRLVSDADAGNAAPGTVIERDDDSILIQTGDGPLRIVAWRDGNEGM
jgi:methionyl-tRNA formyltransferase